MTNSSAWKLIGLTLLLIVTYLFKGVFAQPPAIDPDHTFNTERAFARLERILGDETPHPVDTAANDAVRERLITEIVALGFEPFVRDDFHCRSRSRQARCARLQNIGFWVTEPGPNAVMVTSHYDSVPAGPGASDDGAGYAASLEIAAVLRGRAFPRPLLILITDGEEIGLMGANLFARNDPLASQIGAVVNMEARGVRGLSSLIQTSHPNERDIAALMGETRLPLSNSLNADIYELLPNDTDMTEFLSLPIDAANLAYAGGVSFYHTPGDNLANMDKRAFFNIGANALAITEGFLNNTDTGPEARLLYADLFGTILLVLPVWLGGVFISLGALVSLALLLLGQTRQTVIRATAAPLMAMIVGLFLAIAITMFIDLFRVEQLFGTGYPMALRGVHASAMLLGGLLAYTLIARGVPKTALYGGGWFWFSALGGLAFSFVRGSGSIFALTAFFFAIAAGLMVARRQRAGEIVGLLGVLLFAAIAFPTSALGETGLLIENSAPFAFILGAVLIAVAPILLPEDGLQSVEKRMVLGAPGILLAVFFIASLVLPAYSANALRGFNILHVQSESGDQEPVWSLSANEPLPETFASIADFERRTLPGTTRPYFLSPAPRIERSVRAALIGDAATTGTRELAIQVSAPDADYTTLQWNSDVVPLAARLNGVDIDLNDVSLNDVRCFGRSCRGMTLELTLPANSKMPGVDISSYTYGLPASADFLVNARPNWTTPVHYGDMQLHRSRLEIDGFEDTQE